MAIPEIVLGEDVTMNLTVQDSDGDVVDVSDASGIQVVLFKTDFSERVAGPYTASSGATGADWSNGIVPVNVEGDDTSGAAVTELYAQLKVTGGSQAGDYYSRVKIRAIKDMFA